jgi:hypothetical protein
VPRRIDVAHGHGGLLPFSTSSLPSLPSYQSANPAPGRPVAQHAASGHAAAPPSPVVIQHCRFASKIMPANVVRQRHQPVSAQSPIREAAIEPKGQDDCCCLCQFGRHHHRMVRPRSSGPSGRGAYADVVARSPLATRPCRAPSAASLNAKGRHKPQVTQWDALHGADIAHRGSGRATTTASLSYRPYGHHACRCSGKIDRGRGGWRDCHNVPKHRSCWPPTFVRVHKKKGLSGAICRLIEDPEICGQNTEEPGCRICHW